MLQAKLLKKFIITNRNIVNYTLLQIKRLSFFPWAGGKLKNEDIQSKALENIDLKNNSQSNFTESLSRNKKMDSKEIKENEIINKLASKNLEAKYEQKINNTDFTFDPESQSFISRIKNGNMQP